MLIIRFLGWRLGKSQMYLQLVTVLDRKTVNMKLKNLKFTLNKDHANKILISIMLCSKVAIKFKKVSYFL